MNTEVFNGVFWTAFITAMVGMVLKLTNMCYKSKCKSIDCWGLKIIRDTALEEEIDKLTIPGIQKQTSNENLNAVL